jgi:uncharacterized protein YxjI
MLPELTPPKQPIGIRPELIVDKPTTFQFQQQGKGWSSGKFTAFCPDDDDDALHAEENEGSSKQPERQTLISVDGKYLSRDGRRSFRDASGLPLFDIQVDKSGASWSLVLPGGDGGDKNDTPMARIRPRSSSLKDNLEVDVHNAAANGEEVTLLVSGQDIWKQRTNVYLGDKVVMTTKRTDKLATYLPGKKVEWTVDLAAGTDISLAVAILVVMAANMYTTGQRPSSIF